MRHLLRSAYSLILTLLGFAGLAAGTWMSVNAMDAISGAIPELANIAPIQVVFGSALMVAGALLIAGGAIRAAIRHGHEPPSDY